jgi:hypothetical protein
VHNTASLSLAEKTGFKFLADVHYSKLFGVKKWKWKKCTYENHQVGRSSLVAQES